jgi:hypothetical protein
MGRPDAQNFRVFEIVDTSVCAEGKARNMAKKQATL